MIQKLRWKFIFITTFLSFAIISIVMFFAFTSVYDGMIRESEDTLRYMMEHQEESQETLSEIELDYYIGNQYIMLSVNKDGVIDNIHSNYSKISNETQLLSIVADSLNAEWNMGVLESHNLRYLRKENTNGWDIVYLDMTMEINLNNGLLKNMYLITIGSCTGIFFLSIALAMWITKPVEKAWEQQRQFVADASHELKTPLTVILSNADMMMKNIEEADEPTHRRLSNIRAESVRMRGLVEDLLYLSRGDSGNLHKDMAVVSASDTLMDCVLNFEPVAFEKSKKLQYKLSPELYTMADENHLKQLFSILLDNALKYTNEDGYIWVELEHNSAKTLRVMVANSGETMTDEQCKMIFERFYRTDPAREHNGGYGLGLAIASSIVREMNGKIWCESHDGINRFYVQLPLVKEEREFKE